MDSVKSLRARWPEEFAAMVRLIRNAGTDNPSHFGNEYVKEGGYSLQQNPDEFAALVLHLQKADLKGRSLLEIGSASGGTARFLYEQVGFGRILSLDDGGHHRYPELAGNLAGVPVEHLKADSHGEEAKKWLHEKAGDGFETVFIDGDHSEAGVWKDIELTHFCWRRGSFIILHDIVVCEGVKKAWERGAKEHRWVPFAEYIGAEKPLGIGVGIAL